MVSSENLLIEKKENEAFTAANSRHDAEKDRLKAELYMEKERILVLKEALSSAELCLVAVFSKGKLNKPLYGKKDFGKLEVFFN